MENIINTNVNNFDTLNSQKKEELLSILQKALKRFQRKHYYINDKDSSFIDFYDKKSQIFYSYVNNSLKNNIHLNIIDFEKNIIKDISNFNQWFQDNHSDYYLSVDEKIRNQEFKKFKLGRNLIQLAKTPDQTLSYGIFFVQEDNNFVDKIEDQSEQSLFKKFSMFFLKKLSSEIINDKSEAKKNLEILKNKFGFKSIVLESITSHSYNLDYMYLNKWAKQVNKTLTEISEELNVPFTMMSLNGRISLEYSRLFNLFSSAAGTFSYLEHSISLSASNDNEAKRIWIHEYTHALDWFCGQKIFNSNNMNSKKYDSLSSYVIQSYIYNKKFDNEEINSVSKNIINLFYDEDSSNVSEKHILKFDEFSDTITNIMFLSLLEINNIKYFELTTEQQDIYSNLFNECKSKFKNTPILFSDLDDVDLLKKHIHSYNIDIVANLKLYFKDSTLIDNLDKIKNDNYKKYDDIILNIFSYVKESNFQTFIYNENVNAYFPDSIEFNNLKEKIKEQDLKKQNYYKEPSEIFARSIERIYIKDKLPSDFAYRDIIPDNYKETSLDIIKQMISIFNSPEIKNEKQPACRNLILNKAYKK